MGAIRVRLLAAMFAAMMGACGGGGGTACNMDTGLPNCTTTAQCCAGLTCTYRFVGGYQEAQGSCTACKALGEACTPAGGTDNANSCCHLTVNDNVECVSGTCAHF
jgi:hypothetical protein